MAPTKSTRSLHKPAANTTLSSLMPLARKAVTRRTNQNIPDPDGSLIQTRGKRKAEHSPIKNEKVKRSALGNLTNNAKMTTTTQVQMTKEIQNIVGGSSGLATRQALNKITTRAIAKNASTTKVLDEQTNKTIATAGKVKPKKVEAALPAPPPPPAPVAMPAPIVLKTQHKTVRRISNDFNKTEDSLYMSALEDISSCESNRRSEHFEAVKRRSALLQQEKNKTEDKLNQDDVSKYMEHSPIVTAPIPEGVEDFDKANWNDPFQVSCYTMEIFNYLKARESEFPIDDYIKKQVHLTQWMRSLLVDWMVEVQETFELNHETLYLAVKIVDLYLCRVVINKDKLQLLGAAALFIACKYDERTPPLIDDFLYICDGAYNEKELVTMERATLRTIDFDLGIPLSYRFLRRYARCSKVTMPTLTLARFILELSLMDYSSIRFSDSKLAAAALFIALRMHGISTPWTDTLEHYTGYKLNEFVDIVFVLNSGLHHRPRSTIKTIRNKYSHKIFHEVAKVKLLTFEQLLLNNLDLGAYITKDEKNT